MIYVFKQFWFKLPVTVDLRYGHLTISSVLEADSWCFIIAFMTYRQVHAQLLTGIYGCAHDFPVPVHEISYLRKCCCSNASRMLIWPICFACLELRNALLLFFAVWQVFLQHLTPLLSLSTFTALWLTILEYMDKYMHLEHSDLLVLITILMFLRMISFIGLL